MALDPGRRLGHYEVVESIGVGGMGEVYRAKDTKLGRDVAIKVLPDALSGDRERLGRFEREARLLAQLNHANVATLHGLEASEGQPFLVMELVEGETLAERITRGPLPIAEAIPLFIQIAGGLEAAHEKGILHRDLKPANVMIAPGGEPKILDFGLAKAFTEEEDVSPETSHSPTLTRGTRLRQGFGASGTAMGVILGTAAYMSPEQARGKEVDKRTDIWAFGCCLYEALTGQKAFEAEDVSLTLAEVMKSEPDWSALPPDVPPSLVLFLKRSLEKDPRRRLRDIGDVRLALEGAFDIGSAPVDAAETPLGWRPSRRMAAAALTLSVLTGLAVWRLSKRVPSPRPVARFTLPLPPGISLTGTGRHAVAVSPDGTRLVLSANEELYLRAMDQTEATPIRGTEGGARNPFFSPDGEWIGFWVGGRLEKVAIRGGAPVRLCEAENPWGASFSADDTIVFGQRGLGILRVSAAGGTPEVLVPLEGTTEVGDGPQILPGGKTVLFTLGDGYRWNDAQIVAHSLETGETKVLIEGGRDARYLPTGHLVYVLEGTLLAVPFDAERLEVTGGPVPMVEGIMTAIPTGAAQFDVSGTGSLVYVAGSSGSERTLVWVDRQGKEEALTAEPRAYRYPRLSPDGSRLALDVSDQEADIWIWDFTRETLARLTFAPGRDIYPVWTPDGRRVAFSSLRDGTMNLYWKVADGTGAVERLTESEVGHYPYGFTPDGSQLVYLELQGQVRSLRVLALDGSSEPLLATEFNERNAEISPDGRWLAYQSNASGRDEIYVRPFPNVDEGQWLISRDGGTRPLWSPDGEELFFLSRRLQLTAARIQTEPTFAASNPKLILERRYFAIRGGPGRTYDIAPDGERFLMIKDPAGEADASTIVLVQNWFRELEQEVPAEK